MRAPDEGPSRCRRLGPIEDLDPPGGLADQAAALRDAWRDGFDPRAGRQRGGL